MHPSIISITTGNINYNINDEASFQKDLEDIIIPAYKVAAEKMYDISTSMSESDLLRNLAFDTFLFVHFHEQMHPWLCPNSKADEKKISKVLYEGICEAEPGISKSDAMFKVNNCKNLIWDVVLNTSFVSKINGGNNDLLEEKIHFVFRKNNREIAGQPIVHYPSEILLILYMTSAHNHRTDVAISLIGSFYASLSYNDPALRQNTMQIFLDDLKSKKMYEGEKVLNEMYLGLIGELDPDKLKFRGVNVSEYKERVKMVAEWSNPNYEDNQRYFVETITNIFDSPSLRYGALKGFIKPLSKYISLAQKQGNPNPNSGGSDQGDSNEKPDGDASNSNGNSSEDEMDTGNPEKGKRKSQEEMDADSIDNTLDDLLDQLDGKEIDTLLDDIANSTEGGKAGQPSKKKIQQVKTRAIDEHYKKNSQKLEIRNPAEEQESVDIGTRKQWTLVSSNIISSQQAAMLNQRQIINFQRVT